MSSRDSHKTQKTKKTKTRRFNKKFLLIPLILAGLLSLLIRGGRREVPAASGYLERDRILLPARSFERILSIEAEEGDRVSKDQILIRQDDRRSEAILERAEAERDAAQARLNILKQGARPEEIRQLRALLTAAEGVLKEREDNLMRSRELAQKNFSSQAELDSAESAWKQARGNRDELDARLDLLLAGARAEELDEASAALSAAEAALEKARLDLQDLTLRAPRSGLLESLPLKEGSTPAAGQTLAVILAGNAPYARVYIPETHIASFHSGDKVAILVDGLETPLSGRIARISSEPVFTPYFALNQSDRGRLSYIARIELKETELAAASAAADGTINMNLQPGTPVRMPLDSHAVPASPAPSGTKGAGQ